MPRKVVPRYIEDYRQHSVVYEKSRPEGRLHVVCPQCRALVLLCDSLSRTDRQRIAAQAKADVRTALGSLETMLACGGVEAKAIIQHLRREDAGCSYCGAEMPRGALLCAECMSVNLDWS